MPGSAIGRMTSSEMASRPKKRSAAARTPPGCRAPARAPSRTGATWTLCSSASTQPAVGQRRAPPVEGEALGGQVETRSGLNELMHDHEQRHVDERQHDRDDRTQRPHAARATLVTRAVAQMFSERAGAPHQPQVDDHDHDGDGGQGGGERDVGRLAVEDQVAEHLGLAADDLDGDVVTERQREGEDRAGDHRRDDHRQHDRPERPPRPGAEVAGRLQQRVGQPLEAGVDRQHHERQPQVRQRDAPPRSARTRVSSRWSMSSTPFSPSMMRQANALDQVAGPQRRQHGDHQQLAHARAGDLGHVERDRQRQHASITVTATATPRSCAGRPCGRPSFS